MTSIPLWSMKQASSLPSYSFLFLGRSSGVWRRTAPAQKHRALQSALESKPPPPEEPADAREQIQTEPKQLRAAGRHQRRAQKNNTRAPAQNLRCPTVRLLFSCRSLEQMLGSLKQAHGGSGVQAVRGGESTKTGVHTHTHAPIRRSVLTVLLEDPGDCFVHILLQFGTVKTEGALEGDQTNSLC